MAPNTKTNGTQSWHAELFDFFDPMDTFILSWALPCIVFGKTSHRIHKSGTLEGYGHCNGSCFALTCTGCCGLHCIPMTIQRGHIRKKYNLEGNCMTDLCLTCCCPICVLVQDDKEAVYREGLLLGAVNQQYEANADMVYSPETVAASTPATGTGR